MASSGRHRARLGALRRRTPEMVEALADLVNVESPSDDAAAVAACAMDMAAMGRELLGTGPEWHEIGGWPHLCWRFGTPRVLLLGHLDTVWPAGTVVRWPFAIQGDVATGPGVFDMKAGLVQGLFALAALAALDDLEGVSLLVTSDEELGSPTSRRLVEDAARGLRAALVLEPALGGALKTARKGVSTYRLDIEGRAAHSGLEPERGVNALVELAHQVLGVGRIGRLAAGTSVTPTAARAGTTANTVPAAASVHLDVRARTVEEQERVDRELRRLLPVVPGTRLRLHGGPNRPPLPESASGELFRLASRLAEELGISTGPGAEVGGGSDGNFTAGVGTPTLDGLGAVGDGAHAEGEHVVVPALAERAALVAALVDELCSR